ncbi:MAG: vanadium-dependent haloperoxidase, partial [Akkermansiaceae bacterium]|nr:vanadium-dependent haloperoxidase [Akkermansiaceae bacterium]
MHPRRPYRCAATLALLSIFASVCAHAQSVARLWNEQNLAAIRIDFPDPAQHARNLFTTSVAMWDAWAAYDPTGVGYIHREAAVVPDVPELTPEEDLQAAREEAISYAAYHVLVHRYQNSVNAYDTLLSLDSQMVDLGYPPSWIITTGNSPAAVGQRIAATVIAFFANDGSNEAGDYEDPTYAPVNDPMILDLPFQLMDEPNRWQPLAFEFAFTQNGLEAEQVQTFIGSNWGEVRPFALHREEGQVVYCDPGAPPQLGGPGDAEFKANSLDVVRFSRALDPDEAPLIDCSPASSGNNTLGENDGTGYVLNPVTGTAYDTSLVSLGDFGRVLAEFWADGPDSETPPGHWNTLANEAVEHVLFERRIGGTGPELAPLEWDVKMYLALNGAVHDSAVAAWGCKRAYDYVRPISSIRQLCKTGAMPLEPGLSEVITNASTQPGERHAHLAPHVGKIALYCWGGEPNDPETEYTGNEWILGERWLPYQRDTFVTPAFAGYISGHSTFSRAAAEVLTAMTGSPYFPGGYGSHTTPAGGLEFEFGPSVDVTLQWASYYDAADQAGISRLYGGIHVAPDDGPGRIVGSKCGIGAWNLARKYYDGSILTEEIPIRMEQLAGGDLAVKWNQSRGLFYNLNSASTLPGAFTPLSAPILAEDDRGEMVIPAGSVSGQN